MERDGDLTQELLLGTFPGTVAYRKRLSNIIWSYLFVLSLIDGLVLCFLLYSLFPGPYHCDSDLSSWLTVFCAMIFASVVGLGRRYNTDPAFSCDCCTCFLLLFRSMEAWWVSVGYFRYEDTEECSEELTTAALIALVAYGAKLALLCFYCCIFLAVSLYTSHQNAIRSMSERELAQYPERLYGQAMGACMRCRRLLSPYSVVIQLPCSHIFHSECVKTFLRRAALCPLCLRRA